MLNVNQQMVVPRAPFDQYWAALTPEQENHPSASRTLSTILQQLSSKQVERIEVGHSPLSPIDVYLLTLFL